MANIFLLAGSLFELVDHWLNIMIETIRWVGCMTLSLLKKYLLILGSHGFNFRNLFSGSLDAWIRRKMMINLFASFFN